VRIFYQSFLDPDRHLAYFERLQAYLTEIAGPGTTFELAGVSPPDVALSRLTELRCAVQAIDHVIAAERRGCDAAILGHFQDSGLYEARSSVAIPVLGLGEASMLYAAQLGRGLGLVTIDDVFVSWHREQADLYGLRSRLVGVASMRTPVADLTSAFEDEAARERVLEAFEHAARPLAASGAEVIVPAGGLFGLLTARDPARAVDGAVVLNPLALVPRLAEVAVSLRLSPSRRSTFAAAPEQAVEEFRALARGGA
jgi:allantoin racemase